MLQYIYFSGMRLRTSWDFNDGKQEIALEVMAVEQVKASNTWCSSRCHNTVLLNTWNFLSMYAGCLRNVKVHVRIDLLGRRWCIPPIWLFINEECCCCQEGSNETLQWTATACTHLGQFLWYPWCFLESHCFWLDWFKFVVVYSALKLREIVSLPFYLKNRCINHGLATLF